MIQTMWNLHVVSYYVTYLQGKIPNLEYYQYIKKNFTKMTFHVRGFMAFRSNDQCYGYNRCIVCDNVPILCTHVHPGMTINVAGGSFPFRRTENVFSIFRVQKMGYFVKQPPNERFKMVPPHFSKILGNLKWTTSQPGCFKPFSPPFVKKINSCRIDKKSVRSELQVYDIMLMIFWKNHY